MRTYRMKRAAQKGFILPGVIAFMLAITIIGGAAITIILTNFSVVGNNITSQKAFNIAEAGLNYYLWHLSHNATDYKDGQSTPTTPDAMLGYGPYVHTYVDDNAANAGTYTLWIKPQATGSSMVTVRSKGTVAGTNISRTVQAQVGAASFASYGLVADTEFWFGSNESANGPVFSNVGVHMDGSSSDTVSSANASYTPQGKYGGDGASHNGVWCSSAVTTPVNCNTRNKTNWLYPKPAVDFNLVAGSLCSMKKIAFADYSSTASYASMGTACSQVPITTTNAYLPQRSTSSFSTTQGYLIQLNTNGTYDLYKVNGENDKAADYTSALSTQVVSTGIAIPPSGVIFAEDNVWVRTQPGGFHGRVSIASGRLATTNSATITIADDVLYSAKDGSDAIGLIAEKDVLIAPYAPPASGGFNFEVDAATLAQSGSVTWPQYYDGTTTCTKGWVASNQNFIYYGSVATRQDWTWNYSRGSSCGDAARDSSSGTYYSGIERTATNYDYNLLYAPPPSYPITGSYDIFSWREVLAHP